MIQAKALILGTKRLGPLFYRFKLKSPSISSQARPGQFVHLRIEDSFDPLLRRPFSIHHTDPSQGTFDLLFKVRGKGTRLLSQKSPAEELDLIGPLGNGFPLPTPGQSPILVAGGIGIASLFMLAERLTSAGSPFFWGVKGKEEIFLRDELSSLGWRLSISTEDGSLGYQGLVTDLLQDFLARAKGDHLIYACGPWGMLREVARLSQENHLPCWVSLEGNMACGVGACWGCAVRCRVEGEIVYRRICKEGPIFAGREVIWD
jgi:dihydroorotate dehydrogenase electron transfer subunit